MKKNMLKVMEKLNIDEDIRGLIGKLWKHLYKTSYSCSGHQYDGKFTEAYVIFQEGSGDDWFERNALDFGLKRTYNDPCCNQSLRRNSASCSKCGAGVNGYAVYRGILRRN